MTAIFWKTKNTAETDSWCSIFTNFDSDAKSCLFIKQLTSTCISTILYLRKVFPDDFFEAKNFEGMTLKLLKPRKEENFVSKIEKWLEGAFEAIEKKYLKRLMLDIQDAETGMTLEIYTMAFNYNKEKEVFSLFPSTVESNKSREFTISNTKLSTVKLIQMCYAVTQTYGILPFQVKLSMRLSYYENTPEDYQPKGYMSSESIDPEFPKQARNIEIGVTELEFQSMKIKQYFQDMKDQFENSNSTLLLGQTNNLHKLENITPEKQTRAKRELCFDNSYKSTDNNLSLPQKKKDETKFLVLEKCPSISKSLAELFGDKRIKNVKKTKTKAVNISNNISVKGEVRIRCACISNDKSLTMLTCLGCGFFVHAECFGILQFDSSKKIRFYCHLCHQLKNNFRCHDKVLISLKSSSDQLKLALLRRVLWHCTLPSVTKITLRKMEKIAGINCSKNVVNIVLNKMIEIGVAVPQGKKKNHFIDKHVLTNKLVHYFYKVQNSPQRHSQKFWLHDILEDIALRKLNLHVAKKNQHRHIDCLWVLPKSAALENCKRKTDVNELFLKKKTNHFTGAEQAFFSCNNKTS